MLFTKTRRGFFQVRRGLQTLGQQAHIVRAGFVSAHIHSLQTGIESVHITMVAAGATHGVQPVTGFQVSSVHSIEDGMADSQLSDS